MLSGICDGYPDGIMSVGRISAPATFGEDSRVPQDVFASTFSGGLLYWDRRETASSYERGMTPINLNVH